MTRRARNLGNNLLKKIVKQRKNQDWGGGEGIQKILGGGGVPPEIDSDKHYGSGKSSLKILDRKYLKALGKKPFMVALKKKFVQLLKPMLSTVYYKLLGLCCEHKLLGQPLLDFECLMKKK
jgi:hypothetical protein